MLEVVSANGRPSVRASIAVNRLGAKILCKRHNEALSDLDDVAGRFAAAIATIPEVLSSGASSVRVFRGEDIERWMLKVMCGSIWAGRSRSNRTLRFPVEWLRAIFEGTDSPGLTLFYSAPNDRRLCREAQPMAAHRVLTATTDREDLNPFPIGFWMTFLGVRLVLQAHPIGPPLRFPQFDGESLIHRPGEIRFHRGSGWVSLLIGWERPSRGETVRLRFED
jgi:hypothetical protein